MEITTFSFNKSGKNEDKIWSVKLEIPVFQNPADDFYNKMCDVLTERAKNEGLSIVSHLTVTYQNGNESSVLSDILFCRGRELISLIRIADNRRDGLMIKCPKKHGGDCWFRKGDRYYKCLNDFKSGGVNRSSYKRFLREIPL